MARRHKFLIGYFIFFGVLAAIAVAPGGALTLLILTAIVLPLFGMPGFLAIASPTIMIYSVALLPLWFALNAGRRGLWFIVPALLVPVAVAFAPGYLSRQEAAAVAARMSHYDFARDAAAKPKSIELIADLESGVFVYGQEIGAKNASCNEICRRLLFNGEAVWVRMTRIPSPYMGSRKGTTWRATYRIDRRDSCPQLYPTGMQIEKAVRDRLIAGDCLVEDSTINEPAEVTIRLLTNYYFQHYPAKPPKDGPASIETVKELLIERRADGGAAVAILRRTETVARTTAVPFYIGNEMHMQGGYNGPTIGREKTVVKAIDLAQTMRDAFRFKIEEIPGPPPENAAKIAERVLALPPETYPTLSAQQQDAVNDFLAAMAKQSTLSDTDVDFVRRVIADKRVTEGKLGIVFQSMFGKFTARLEPLIPAVLDRISTPVPEQVGHYQSMLGWLLTNFSADSLRPYREQMVKVAEAQADWPSGDVLTRLAELGSDDGVKLVIRRMDSKTSLRQLAAVAACRASAEAWPALEPAVLAHLTPPRQGNTMQDDERPLLLALVRHGKKELAGELIDKRGLFDAVRTRERLAKFDAGFDPKRCQDYL